jgi:hypothetical protein
MATNDMGRTVTLKFAMMATAGLAHEAMTYPGSKRHEPKARRWLGGDHRMLKHLRSSLNEWKLLPMTDKLLLAVCTLLIGFGIFTIAVSSGFFMNLLGAGTMALGGAAAYLILSHRAQPTSPRPDSPKDSA